MRWLILCLALSGCATLQKPETLRLCMAADLVTTIYGVHTLRLREVNPIVKASVNAGHFLPMILLGTAVVLFVEWLNEPDVTATVAAIECGAAVWNVTVW